MKSPDKIQVKTPETVIEKIPEIKKVTSSVSILESPVKVIHSIPESPVKAMRDLNDTSNSVKLEPIPEID
jgi:hypothetical protein